MENTRRAVRQDERTVAILCLVLFMLVLTAGVIWLRVFQMFQAGMPVLPTEVELSPAVEPPAVDTVHPSLPKEAVPVTAMTSRHRWSIVQLPTVVKRLPEEEPFVYLTFDDGPTKYLEAIVDILIDKQAPATFFWIGQYAPPAPELLNKMRQAHLQFGTHTVNHQRLAGLPYPAQRKEIERGIAALAKWTGAETVYVRPPYGAWDELTQQVADDLGLKLVLWSIDPRDWEKEATPDIIIERILSHLHPGAVIVLHEKEATLQALPTLIDRIRQNGYQLAGLPQD